MIGMICVYRWWSFALVPTLCLHKTVDGIGKVRGGMVGVFEGT
jgi:hypothetical protein